MQVSSNSHHTPKGLADFLVDHRRSMAILVALATVALAIFMPALDRDPSLKSVIVSTSGEYLLYKRFVEIFGNDEFIIVAMRSQSGEAQRKTLSTLESITAQIEALSGVTEVTSLANLRLFQKRGDRFGAGRVLQKIVGQLRLPDQADWERIRNELPIMDFLVSKDLRTYGILIRVDERLRLDHEANDKILREIDAVVRRSTQPGEEYGIAGGAVFRRAFSEYSLQSAINFAIACALICAVVAFYIFRSLKVTVVGMAILGLCVFWTMALMSLSAIPLNAATSLTFGLILIPNLEIFIHMAIRYRQFRTCSTDSVDTAKETMRFLGRPCLMCAATAAVGFGSCMVTSIPVAFQFGFIMSLGLMLAFCLSMVMAPSFLGFVEASHVDSRKSRLDFAQAPIAERMQRSIARHHLLFAIGGVCATIILFMGIPFVRTDPQLLRQLQSSSPEVRSLQFIETNLTYIHVLELMLESQDRAFEKPESWKKVEELEDRLKQMPEVVATDSFLSYLKYGHSVIKDRAAPSHDLFSNPGLIPQLVVLSCSTKEGKAMTRRYLNSAGDKLRISVRVKNSPSVPITETIHAILHEANSVMGSASKAAVTGELAVIAEQYSDFVVASIYSLLLAIVIITILLMIQMGTPLFGLISLIPNIPPVAAVWGIMGALAIPLDTITVTAATVSIGLAADNTIQYVAQLKREMKQNPDLTVEECVFRAYRLAAKPMATWSFVTMLGFLAVMVTPFQAAHNFGILVSAAILMGVFGDLVFLQSIILSSSWVRGIIKGLIQAERLAGK